VLKDWSVAPDEANQETWFSFLGEPYLILSFDHRYRFGNGDTLGFSISFTLPWQLGKLFVFVAKAALKTLLDSGFKKHHIILIPL
jgi:hypothetical protein